MHTILHCDSIVGLVARASPTPVLDWLHYVEAGKAFVCLIVSDQGWEEGRPGDKARTYIQLLCF